MKNQLFLHFSFSLLLVSANVYSSVNCGEAQITEILVYDEKVVVKHGARYRGLGFTTSARNQDKKLSIVLAAKATGNTVTLVYPDGYDCSVDNYGADPEIVIVK